MERRSSPLVSTLRTAVASATATATATAMPSQVHLLKCECECGVHSEAANFCHPGIMFNVRNTRKGRAQGVDPKDWDSGCKVRLDVVVVFSVFLFRIERGFNV